MLKILFVTNNYTPYSGGVVSSIQSCTTELENHGNSVIIATLDFGQNDMPDKPNVKRLSCPIKFHYKNNPMAIPWYAKQQLYDLVQTYQPDIIHTHHPFLLGDSALKVACNKKIPVVFTYHTMYEHYLHYVPFPQCFTRIALRKQLKTFCNKANGIIAPSSVIAERVARIAPNVPTRVIASSLQAPFLPMTTFENKQRETPFKLLLVGRLVKEKNIPFLIKLFSTLDQNRFHLTIIGYGPETESLQHYAYNTLKLSKERIQFIIHPPKQLIADWYKKADLFVFPSFSDTQGIVLAEAMAAGTPVVAVDGPGQRDIIKQGINGFIVKSSEEMRRCIQSIANDSALHHQLQHNAWQTSHEFLPETTANKLIDWYKKIMKTV